MDKLEGFSRIAPLIGAWLKGGRSQFIPSIDGGEIDLADLLRTSILAGTNPNSREYWGKITHWSQAIVEAPDIALALWLSKEYVWNMLSPGERKQISGWLIGVNNKGIPDNNWRLFVVQVNLILEALKEPYNEEETHKNFARVKEFYLGKGWFKDGDPKDNPGVDYYNAWGFHYQLQWIRQINACFETKFIDEAFRYFITDYKYFIGPSGFPIMGRSACYRMAAPAPHIFAQESYPEIVSPGQGRRALDAVWQFFIKKNSLCCGNVTQGYYQADYALLEDYSGPASCLWSLRSLIVAFSLPAEHPFWQASPEPLPVEMSDYTINIDTIGWTLTGEKSTGKITIKTPNKANPVLVKQSKKERILETITRKPRRPKNLQAKYFRSMYDSSYPYGIGSETEADDIHKVRRVT